VKAQRLFAYLGHLLQQYPQTQLRRRCKELTKEEWFCMSEGNPDAESYERTFAAAAVVLDGSSMWAPSLPWEASTFTALSMAAPEGMFVVTNKTDWSTTWKMRFARLNV
jgi:hypothetical protein